MGLSDTRRGDSGRPRERELSLEEQNARFNNKDYSVSVTDSEKN